MNIYKHPRNGFYFIWAYDCYGSLISERYYYYSKKDSIKLFRQKHPHRKTKGINNVNYCPFIF